jgi:hypothetical protein
MSGKPVLNPDDKTLGIVEGLAKIQCTQREAAAVLGVHHHTFLALLKRSPEARLRWENGLESGKASLRRNQFKLSETNAVMCIWLGKQYLGQREPVRYEGDEQVLGKKDQAQVAAANAGKGTGWAGDLEFDTVN